MAFPSKNFGVDCLWTHQDEAPRELLDGKIDLSGIKQGFPGFFQFLRVGSGKPGQNRGRRRGLAQIYRRIEELGGATGSNKLLRSSVFRQRLPTFGDNKNAIWLESVNAE